MDYQFKELLKAYIIFSHSIEIDNNDDIHKWRLLLETLNELLFYYM